MGDCFKSTGKIVTEERMVANFTSVELEDRINLHLSQSPEFKVQVVAGENLQEHIVVKCKEEVLYISNENTCNWVRSFKKPIDVYLSLPKLELITFRGGGTIKSLTQFTQPSFRLEMWEASGKVNLNLDCHYVSFKSHSGTADVTCIGRARDLYSYSNGSGTINSQGLSSKTALVVNSNSSEIRASVSDSLEAQIRGRGNIHYFGKPKVSLIKTGEGNLLNN